MIHPAKQAQISPPMNGVRFSLPLVLVSRFDPWGWNRVAPFNKQLEQMGLKHDVYPSTKMGMELEAWCEQNNESISGMYKEGIRRMAQDPNHELDIQVNDDEN